MSGTIKINGEELIIFTENESSDIALLTLHYLEQKGVKNG